MPPKPTTKKMASKRTRVIRKTKSIRKPKSATKKSFKPSTPLKSLTFAPPKPQITLGLVYAEWCGHCQTLKPEWAKMKDVISANDKLREQCEILEIESSEPTMNDKIGKINADLFGEKLEIIGYPTIFLKKDGKLEKYEGMRSSDDLLSWVNSKATEKTLGGKRRAKK